MYATAGQYQVSSYLEVTSGVDKDICWLQIPVDDPRGVHVVQPAQDLVQEELEVSLLQVLPRVNYVVQVLPPRERRENGDEGRWKRGNRLLRRKIWKREYRNGRWKRKEELRNMEEVRGKGEMLNKGRGGRGEVRGG